MTRILFVIPLLFSLIQQPSGDEILRKVEEQLAPVNDYIVDLIAEVNMQRLRVPRMKATLYFKKPDKVHFEATGFAMLPREGFTLNPTWLRQNFDATVAGLDTIDARILHKLQLAAKDKSTRIRQLYLWVDTTHWTVAKFETIPYEGRNLSVTFHYAQHDGVFLPDTLQAVFGFVGAEPDSLTGVIQAKPQLREMLGQVRGGTMKVVYSNYRINTGLSDELFQKKEESKEENKDEKK